MRTWISITFHIDLGNPVASGPISIPTVCQSRGTNQRLRLWYGAFFFLVSLFRLHCHSGLDELLLISLFAKRPDPLGIIQRGEKLGWLRNRFICDGPCVPDRR